METASIDNECVFCAKFGGVLPFKREWFDAELTTFGSFVVVPGLGPFAEGYLMILTRRHYNSMARLPEAELSQLTLLKRHVRDVVSQCYRSPIMFEHGPASPMSSGGSCIDHAHIQVLPLDIDLLPLLNIRNAMKPIDKLTALVEVLAQGKPYLFFENQQGQMYVGDAGNAPSQYMRRLIAAESGIPDRWDYAVFTNYELIAATIKRLTPWPGTTEYRQ